MIQSRLAERERQFPHPIKQSRAPSVTMESPPIPQQSSRTGRRYTVVEQAEMKHQVKDMHNSAVMSQQHSQSPPNGQSMVYDAILDEEAPGSLPDPDMDAIQDLLTSYLKCSIALLLSMLSLLILREKCTILPQTNLARYCPRRSSMWLISTFAGLRLCKECLLEPLAHCRHLFQNDKYVTDALS